MNSPASATPEKPRQDRVTAPVGAYALTIKRPAYSSAIDPVNSDDPDPFFAMPVTSKAALFAALDACARFAARSCKTPCSHATPEKP